MVKPVPTTSTEIKSLFALPSLIRSHLFLFVLQQGLTPAHIARKQHYVTIFDILKTVTTTVTSWEEEREELDETLLLEHPDYMRDHPFTEFEEEGGKFDKGCGWVFGGKAKVSSMRFLSAFHLSHSLLFYRTSFICKLGHAKLVCEHYTARRTIFPFSKDKV